MNVFTNHSGYSSIEESPAASRRAGSHLVKCAIASIALFGCFWAIHPAPTDSISAELLVAQQQNQSNTGASLDLPSYLAALDETDPEWDDHSSQLTSRWVVGGPGKGNLVPGQVELVRFIEPHFVFRTYGGYHKASQCGYWWVMDPPKGAKDTYFDHFAICPEWNDATDIIRCRIPVGYVAAVGVGQSVDCPESGQNLSPDPWNLQLNGDICTAAIKMEKHLSCEYCSSNAFDMELSACSNKGPNYVDGFSFGGN